MNFDLSREWLETNGIGGFACGTVIGANTRRYHALLCAATQPPLGRMVLVNKADEVIRVNGKNFALGCNQFGDVIEPKGYEFLHDFSVEPLPKWTYVLPPEATGLDNELVLEKTLWMPYGYNQTAIRYVASGGEFSLHVRPFITGRDYHHIHGRNDAFDTRLHIGINKAGGQEISLRPYYHCPTIQFAYDGAFEADGHWYMNFQYAREHERGLEASEDMYSPGEFIWELREGETALLSISSEPLHLSGQEKPAERLFFDGEIARRTSLTSAFYDADAEHSQPAMRLVRAADQFLVRRASDMRYTVVAGYPWFSDWGRDTMIALPGLCLTTGRIYAAASILLNFASHVSQGMIPNRFPDAGETGPLDYNTFDATLWFFHATGEYFRKTGDWKTTREIYGSLRECLHWHLKGTRFGIIADPEDGLLRGGEGNTQLTWMDAKVGDVSFTPRIGKPVEIQALWFHALKTLSDFATRAEDEETKALCDEWSAKVQANFASKFWNEEENCLFDFIADDGTPNGAIRPNQIFAVSLFANSPYALLSPEQENAVVETVQRELLTPFGLRSLSPRDSQYRGRYEGDQWSRDSAYHQGTVWTWPLGGFCSAYLKVHDGDAASKAQVRTWLEPILQHLDEACVGNINEIFDGDAPHTPRGCFAQAWSVSEVLRVLVDEVGI